MNASARCWPASAPSSPRERWLPPDWRRPRSPAGCRSGWRGWRTLVSVVGLDELMRKSTIAVSYTRQPFTFYFAAALIYLAMSALSMAGMQVLERRAARGVEPAG